MRKADVISRWQAEIKNTVVTFRTKEEQSSNNLQRDSWWRFLNQKLLRL